MILLEILMELLESFTPNKTGCAPDSQAISDLTDCATAYDKIAKGDCKKITHFLRYVESVNELNGRKTLAGHVYIPFYDTIRGCVNLTEKKPIDK
jgi:hypothetical protein